MLIIALTAAAAFVVTSCDSNKTPDPSKTATATGTEQTDISATSADTEEEKVTVTVSVTMNDGSTKDYSITTSEKTLYGAVNSLGIIDGEDGPYGFYLKTVNGVTADYDVDGAYWALYKSGEYLMTGMESTFIADGEHYEIVYTK